VQGEPREGNGDRRERRPAADQPHGRAPTPPACRPTPYNNRRANGGVNVDANTDADAPPLFRGGVSEPCRCGHAPARLPGACHLRGATGAPAA
jgi:hypothetical protein